MRFVTLLLVMAATVVVARPFGGIAIPTVYFGAALPIAPATFSTVSSPPAAGSTCHGSYYTPSDGTTLQTDLNAAAAGNCANGDVIELTAGTTYTTGGSFNLPARTGTAGWIYVISSHAPDIGGSGLPVTGTRVCITGTLAATDGCTPNASLTDFASLRSTTTTSGVPVIGSSNSANHYRLIGLDIENVDTNVANYTVYLSHGDTTPATLDTDITFDRDYVAGAPVAGAKHVLQLDGIRIEITASQFDSCFQQGTGDSNCIVGWNGLGPYRITNNWMHADGETTDFGGSDSTLGTNIEEGDIVITGNHYYKSYFTGTGTLVSGTSTLTIVSANAGAYLTAPMLLSDALGNIPTDIPAGTQIIKQLTGTTGGVGTYQMSANASATVFSAETINAVPFGKNMIEFKAGNRVQIISNFFENAGGQGQARSSLTLTVRNQSGTNPWYTLDDYDIENNIFTNCQFGGINALLQDHTAGGDYGTTTPSYRWLIRNNLWLLSVSNGTTTMPMLVLSYSDVGAGGGGGGDIIIDHNTWFSTNGNIQTVMGIQSGGDPSATLTNFVWSNNIDGTAVSNGFLGPSGFDNYADVWAQVTNPAFKNSAITASADATLPSGNFKPANTAAIDFTSTGSSTAAAGYALTSSSPYYHAGLSGANLPYSSAGTADGSDIGVNISLLPTS